MRKLSKWLGGAVLALLLVGGGFATHVWWFKPLSIDWFYLRTFARFAADKPEMLSEMRVLPPWLDFHGDDLDDASPAQEDRDAALLRSELATLRRYDREALDGEARLSYDTLEYYLRIQVDGEKYRHHDFPVSQLFGVQTQLPDFMLQVHRVTNEREARAYVTRLAGFRVKFDQVLESLALQAAAGIVPPRFAVEKSLAQMQAFVVPPAEHVLFRTFKEKLDKLPADRIDAAARERLLADATRAIEADVIPAYRRLIAHVEGLRAKAQGDFGAWHLPDGDAYYAWCVRLHTSTDVDPGELHRIGLAEVARIGGEMDAILKAHGHAQGSVGQRVRALSRDPAQLYPNTAGGKQAMLAHYRAIVAEMQARLPEAFDVKPKQALEVKPVPAFAERHSPGGYYQAGAFDRSRPGVFFVNLRDTEDTPRFAMRTLAYHEGVPGHHLQSAIAQEAPGLPLFRRVLPFTAYDEGWALYAERLAWEMGLQNDPLDNLGRLNDEMMRAVRLVVDTGIHRERWTRERAIAYMLEHTGMSEPEVVVEIERYFVIPGQALAYKVGMLKILELREKARRALGPRFDLKRFHRELLVHGALPLVVLERVVDEWITKERA